MAGILYSVGEKFGRRHLEFKKKLKKHRYTNPNNMRDKNPLPKTVGHTPKHTISPSHMICLQEAPLSNLTFLLARIQSSQLCHCQFTFAEVT